MNKIKKSTITNIFYTENKELLENQLKTFSKNLFNYYEYKTRAIIVPHAGLIYSGQLAYEGINCLDKNIKNIFIFAPAHKIRFEGLALTSFDKWETPLGKITINQKINQKLCEEFNAKYFDEAHQEEHSIEIQIPIIQHIFNNINIIPILIGKENFQKISSIINKYYTNKDFGFIISSDLSHFLTDTNAQKIDLQTAQMIETGDLQNITHHHACGATGICGLINFANNCNFSLIRINMYNSSSISNDKTKVVGYGAWLLYEGSKNNFIKKYYSKNLIQLCKLSIDSKFNDKTIKTKHPPVLNQFGASFITLKKNNKLRGCIGSIIAHQPLIQDIIKHSQDAAFNDSRFQPVKKDEMKNISISISLLSYPKQIIFQNELDLLRQITPFKDGLIINDKDLQAVYLPSVWEELPDKQLFLNSLKIKAGMPPNYFSNTFKAYKFDTEYIN